MDCCRDSNHTTCERVIDLSTGKEVRLIKRMKKKSRAFQKYFQYFLRYVFFCGQVFSRIPLGSQNRIPKSSYWGETQTKAGLILNAYEYSDSINLILRFLLLFRIGHWVYTQRRSLDLQWLSVEVLVSTDSPRRWMISGSWLWCCLCEFSVLMLPTPQLSVRLV